jgi:hypothetical protein
MYSKKIRPDQKRIETTVQVNFFAIITLLLVVIFIVTAISIAISNDDAKTNSTQKTLNTSGTITKTVAPNKVDIFLNIETTDKSAQVSQSVNARISENVKNALNRIGIQDVDIKTINYYESEQLVWNSSYNRQDSNGYITVNSLQITLKELTKTGNVIDAAVGAGVNRVSGVSFGLTDVRQNEVKAQALQEAAASARFKAESIAAGLGVSLGEVVSISENSYNYYPMMKSLSSATTSELWKSDIATKLTPSDVSVDASVTVQFVLN